jgi:hypothetical protein
VFLFVESADDDGYVHRNKVKAQSSKVKGYQLKVDPLHCVSGTSSL